MRCPGAAMTSRCGRHALPCDRCRPDLADAYARPGTGDKPDDAVETLPVDDRRQRLVLGLDEHLLAVDVTYQIAAEPAASERGGKAHDDQRGPQVPGLEMQRARFLRFGEEPETGADVQVDSDGVQQPVCSRRHFLAVDYDAGLRRSEQTGCIVRLARADNLVGDVVAE